MDYIPVLIMLCAGLGVGGAMLLLSHLLGPKIQSWTKDQPFECGMPPVGDAKQRVPVRFYLAAILFLLFDVEVVFFFPWAIVFRDYLSINAFILVEMAVFVGILLVGYYYVLRKGALRWD